MAAEPTVAALPVGSIAAQTRNALVGGPFGSDLVSADYVPAGVPVIRGQNLSNGKYVSGPFVFVTEQKADRLSANLARPGDLVFTQRGNAVLSGGQVAIVPEAPYPRYVVSQSQMKLTPDRSKVDPQFLYFIFNSQQFRHYLRSNAIVTGVPHINLGLLREYRVSLPPLEDQKAIADILGTLDDKIELNRRMNATLESMARALFAQWFSESTDSVEHHRVQQLIDRGVLIVGDGYRAKNSEFGPGGLPFVRAGNLTADGLELDGAEILAPSSVVAAGQKVGTAGDVAFTSKGTVGRLTQVTRSTARFVYSPQVCFWRSLDSAALHPDVLYRWMSTSAFTRQVDAVSRQTDMAPYVSLQDQRRMVVNLPPGRMQQKVAVHLAPIDKRIAANAAQARTLAALRDTLLPKLLSGELSVRQAEKTVSAVA